MPYVFLITDILSWWLTKIHPMFAWLVILAGMGMGVSFMFMWFTSIAEMWLYDYVFVEGLAVHYERLRKASAKALKLDEQASTGEILIYVIKLASGFVLENGLKPLWALLGKLINEMKK